MTKIERVGVIGLGLMGSGIAEVLARSGVEVIAAESTPESLRDGLTRVHSSLKRATEKGRLSVEDANAAADRISGGASLEALAGCQLMIEAATENVDAKLGIFRKLDVIGGPETILASNTSSIPITDLAAAVSAPERVIGMHFFNPAPAMDLVEVVAATQTDPNTVAAVMEFVHDVLGKTPVEVPDRAGFVVNALLVPYLLSAIRMLDAGRATEANIDTAMRLGCGHPMGPLTLTDLIGLDVVAAAADSMYQEYLEPQYATPPLLLRMVAAGWLGRKSGRGFFPYCQDRKA